MRGGKSWFTLCLLLLLCLPLGSCVAQSTARSAPVKWQLGFWFWRGSWERSHPAPLPVDVVYFQAGEIQHAPGLYRVQEENGWYFHGRLPEKLPPAGEYWAVFRTERGMIPHAVTAAMAAKEMTEILSAARERKIKIAGIQFDIDSPTASLAYYAAYLTEVRKQLPAGMQISITALVDWFRPGTDVGKVIAAVDEFVPQFYDMQNPGSVFGRPVIAEPISAQKWGPVFQQFGKRYRIGISTFGRSRELRSEGRHTFVTSYGNMKPLDVAYNPDISLETSRTPAQEQVLRYRILRNTKIQWSSFHAGTAIEFVLATPESVHAAVEQAKRMGSQCAGVVFFRWPSFNESMALQPDEVLRAAGAAVPPAKPASLRVVDERCANVHCSDLYLLYTPPLNAKPIRYVIESSAELAYFVASENIPARMSGSSSVALTLPPYGGRTQIHLGRVVAKDPATFTLKVDP